MTGTQDGYPGDNLNERRALGMDSEDIIGDLRRHFGHTLGRDRYCRSNHYIFQALALAVRDRLMERWKSSLYAYQESDCRRTYYLSLEFLMGRTLNNALLNLGIREAVDEGLQALGLALPDLEQAELDAGLGNGGLGRLAACFLDSCATLQLPVKGYGIRYEYGMFRQHLENGHQIEEPDHWLRDGNPWEIERPEYTQRIKFGGRGEMYRDSGGHQRGRWVGTQDVLAVPYDVPIPGFRNGTVNTLRLWKAAATDEFDLGEFNAGSYPESVAAKNAAEHITMVLYPNDASENGKELRLRQQYFLASASLQDALRHWRRFHGEDFGEFADKNRFQLNDTHPSCAVPELMRLLMDEHGLAWEAAWDITSRTMAYTNHTLLPEALEQWPVSQFQALLPRLMDVVYEINARFLSQVAQVWPGDKDRIRRMSIISDDGHVPMVRMAYLAIVGSASVNGVAALHSRLLTEGLFRDFHDLWPDRFNNKTNGVTPRRWLLGCNPGLAALLTESVGPDWVTDLDRLSALADRADDPAFQTRWQAVKRASKARLSAMVARDCGIVFDTDALFDVQVKRIHEYKRQLLNVLHLVHLYRRIKAGDTDGMVPRCALIGGKAAPGYFMAKLIVKLVNNVASVVNADRRVAPWLKVAFLPDFRVSAMEGICPGTDLSEQISTAGKEASGTGNMKFMMNGAVTIGTLDGANIEIRDEVGAENFFLFGLTADQVAAAHQGYDPVSIVANDEDLGAVVELLRGGHFNQFEPGLFEPILEAILCPTDPWMTVADFRSYVDAQTEVAKAYADVGRWQRMSILNTAASGRFSTDRTIREYAEQIWGLTPVPALSRDEAILSDGVDRRRSAERG